MTTTADESRGLGGAWDEAPSTLDAGQRAQCAVLARWLETSTPIAVSGLFAAATAAACIVFSGGPLTRSAALLALALTPIERVYALRLRFDRGLFADLAAGRLQNLAVLDAALDALGLRRASTVQIRPLADRIRGTRRLWRVHAVVVAAQVLLCLTALVPHV
jgi:hypothetical protein